MMVDLYSEPLGALQEIHDVFKADIKARTDLSPSRVASIVDVIELIAGQDDSERIQDELQSIAKLLQKAASVTGYQSWSYLYDFVQKTERGVDRSRAARKKR